MAKMIPFLRRPRRRGYSAGVSGTPSDFTVRFWGVRGSIPTPGPSTVRYGGNTTCLEIRCGGELIIIDAGSGLRELGLVLAAGPQPVRATFLFTHHHWDHIQGFPFFGPAFVPQNRFDLWSEQRIRASLVDALRGQMAQPTFPIGLGDMGADMAYHEVHPGGAFQIGPVQVRTAPLNHPGGCTAYRLEYGGCSYVHACDHEHTEDLHAPLLDLARGADWLLFDSTYTDAEYRGDVGGVSHVGWGHSTWQEAVRMAEGASVQNLILFHHDPSHTDDLLDAIGEEARRRFPRTVVAHEGLVLDLLGG